MRMVFWNEVKPNEEQGGMAVDKGACGCARGVHRLTRRRVQRALAWPRGSQRCRSLEGTRVRWSSGHRCCICRAQGWRCEEEGQEIGAKAEADSPYEHASEGYDRPLAGLCCPGVDVQVRRRAVSAVVADGVYLRRHVLYFMYIRLIHSFSYNQDGHYHCCVFTVPWLSVNRLCSCRAPRLGHQ